MKIENVFFQVITPGNPGLIGHHKGEIAEVIDQLHCLASPINPFQLVRAMGIADVGIQHAIAVKKYGAAVVHGRHESLRFGEGCWNADVDERAMVDFAFKCPCRRKTRKDVRL